MKVLPSLFFPLLGVIGAAAYVVGQNPLPSAGGVASATEPLPGKGAVAPRGSDALVEATAEARRLRESAPEAHSVGAAWIPSTSGFNRNISLSLSVTPSPAGRARLEEVDKGNRHPEQTGGAMPAKASMGSVAESGAARTGAPVGLQAGGNIMGAAAAVSAHNPAPLPVAFQEPSPELAANPQAAGVLEQLRQNFVDAIGGVNQDPTDPAYLDRWLAAQKMIDEKFRVTFGSQAFLAAQIAANAHGQ